MQITDPSGTLWVCAFEPIAFHFMGVSAEELLELKRSNDLNFQQVLKDIYMNEYVVQIE